MPSCGSTTGGFSTHARTCAQASAANEATKSRNKTDLCMLALVAAATELNRWQEGPFRCNDNGYKGSRLLQQAINASVFQS